MIEHIKLRFGSDPTAPPLELSTSAVTVFVGPNYSGKSKLIRELLTRCSFGNAAHDEVVLSDVKFQAIPSSEVSSRIDGVKTPLQPGEALNPGHIMVGRRSTRHQVNAGVLTNALTNPNETNLRHLFAQWFLQYQVLVLDGQSRISLVNDQAAGDLQNIPHTTFQVLFRDDDKRSKLSNLVYDAFGLYLIVDPTALGQFRLRLSKTKPESATVERSLTKESVQFHSVATHILQTSDGAKAFVGILAEIIAGEPEILLMDEPEAFLHPGLAFKLGREIAESMALTKKKMFVATHSPQFLMGLIQSGVEVNVVRLTYRNGNATARLLPSAELVKLMRNPLLRSTNVLSALFYETVVITEGDPDRAFYQEINERLLQSKETQRGIPNCVFLNAQNKQTIPTIMKPLRALGIPAAGIYDIDFVKEGGATFSMYLEATVVPNLSRASIGVERSEILKALQATGKDFKRDGGINVLDVHEREAAQNFLDKLASYGSFIVAGGELESWLSHLAATGHGPKWLIQVFEKMGEDPESRGYLKPGNDDVWSFLDQIRIWSSDPNRKGIPN